MHYYSAVHIIPGAPANALPVSVFHYQIISLSNWRIIQLSNWHPFHPKKCGLT